VGTAVEDAGAECIGSLTAAVRDGRR